MKKKTKKLLAGALIVPMAFSAYVFGSTGVLVAGTEIEPSSTIISAATGSATLDITATINSNYEVVLPSGKMAFNVGDSEVKKNAGTIKVTDETKANIGKVMQVTVKSANGGQLLNDSTPMGYTLKGNANSYVASTISNETKVTSSGVVAFKGKQTVVCNDETVDLTLVIASGTTASLPAGDYTDTLTFEVTEVQA